MKTMAPTLRLIATLLFGGLLFQAEPLHAAPFLDDDEEEAAPEEEDSENGAEDEDADEWLAVVGGDVYTGLGDVLRGATVLSKNGTIEEIGYDLWIPAEAELLDARGFRVYPGMVALSATSRVTQGTLAPEDPDRFVDLSGSDEDVEDWPEDWGPVQDEVAADSKKNAKGIIDDYDPFSPYMILTLASGITTVEQSGSAVKLKRDTIEGVLLAEDSLVSFSFGSADARARARDDFAKAAEYLRAYRAWEAAGDEDADEPSKRGVNTGALRVLRGEGRAKFSSSDQSELLGIARLAQKYGFRPVIEGAREGWIVADELGRAGATIVLTPRERRWKDEQQNAPGGSSIENAAKLHAAGCQIAVKASSGSIDLGGIAGRDLIHLMIEAGFAVRGGLTNQAALEAVTVVPARVLGADHRIGTLEVGKDCDLVVTDGDLLHYETFVQYAVVSGTVAYDKQEELYYAHIRPRAEREPLEHPGGEEQPSEEGDEDSEDEAEDEDDEDEKDEPENGEDEPEDEDGEG